MSVEFAHVGQVVPSPVAGKLLKFGTRLSCGAPLLSWLKRMIGLTTLPPKNPRLSL